MSLKRLMEISQTKGYNTKQGMSEERVREQLPHLRKLISFYRQYPDFLIDFYARLSGPDNKFKLYMYQRIYLREAMRHRYLYATYPRAFSKSFLSMMILMLRCILYPGSQLFVTTGGKQQAASITISKIDEICRLIPALASEINWDRGVSKKSKDDVHYIFKNGSSIDILAARESSRGQRRTGGLMQECILIDQTALNEIIIPTTNINRQLADGSRHKQQVVNKSQIYITTAGYKDSFAYRRLIQLLVQSIIEPDQVMVVGGSWQTPVAQGLLDENFVEQLKLQGTYAQESFSRQYGSKWSGDISNAFYSAARFDKSRVLATPQYECSGSKNAYYVIGVDVGRFGCTTQAIIFKVMPQLSGPATKNIMNIFTYQAQHFEQQAIYLKKLFYQYHARRIAIDANGIGAGLVDFMVLAQRDPDTGQTLPPFGVLNDQGNKYKQFRTDETQPQAMYLIKANAPLNTQAYTYAKTQMAGGHVKFLIDQSQAKARLAATRHGKDITLSERNEYLVPFVQTTMLRQQILNLVEQNEGTNIILKQSSKAIKKDKFSAFIYGLLYIKNVEETRKRGKGGRDLSGLMLFSS